MSAAKAICDHMRDWWFGTNEVGVAKLQPTLTLVPTGRMDINGGVVRWILWHS